MASGYERAVSPGRTATAPVQAGPDAFGAGVGEAVAGLGNSLQHFAAVERDQQRREQTVTAGVAAEQAKVRVSAAQEQLQQQPSGWQGYRSATEKALADEHDRIAEGLTNRHARDEFDLNWAHYAGAEMQQADHYEVTVGAMARVAGTAEQANIANGRIAGKPTLATWADALFSSEATVDALQAPDNVKEARKRELGQQLTETLFRNMAPADAKATLATGKYDGYLNPATREAVARDIDVRLTREQTLAKAQAGLAYQGEVMNLDLTAQQLQQGRASFEQAHDLSSRYMAAAEQAPTIEKRAEALRKAQDWRGTATEIGAAEGYRGASPQERDARIQALAAKPSLSPAEGAELKGLRGQAGYVAALPTLARMTYATGKGVPPIDWTDPASVKGRTTLWQSAQAQFGGAPDYLLPGEEAPLKEIVASGNASQKIEAMRVVMSLPGQAAARVLNAVAPADDGFRAAATLARIDDGGERMRMALQGEEAQRANKQLWVQQRDAMNKPVGPNRDEMWASFAPALAALPPAYVADLRANTQNIYAANAQKAGWHDFHPVELPRALRFALGGGKIGGEDTGGLGTRNGVPVLLPRGLGQAEFDRRISRAGGAAWERAAVDGPAVMAGGRPAYTGELRNWVPVAVDPDRGIYAMRQGNAYVQGRNGKRYLFDINRLVP